LYRETIWVWITSESKIVLEINQGDVDMKLKPIITLILFIALFGCSPHPNVEETQLFSTNTMIQTTPTSTLAQPTPTPTAKLQLTYIQFKEDKNLTEFYATDITCTNADKICFGEPKLLFQSLEASNSDQNLPKGFIADYSWSPDGTKIVLASSRDILIGDMNSQEWTNIANTAGADHAPKWSADGKFIYYIACNEDPSGMCTPQLIKYDLASKQKQQLLQAWNKPFSSDYAISPDGQKIIFSISGPLAISDLLYQANWDGTDSYQITSMDVSEIAPSFSLDGLKIAFVRRTIKYFVDSKEESDIIVRDLTSGEEKNLTENFDGLAFSPAFSPNGDWIVFDSFDSNLNVNIFLVSINQKVVIQATYGNNETNPAWRWIQE
jgi:Tol biopolymer transport system component